MDQEPAGKAARQSLTDKLARKIPAPTEGYALVRDGSKDAIIGFALRITCPTRSEPTGARAWLLCYRNKDGRERRMTIGRIDAWPVKAAREEAKRLRRIADAGGDPLKERQDERAAETVDDLADRYVDEHLPRLRKGSRLASELLLRKWVRPALGKFKVKEIEHADVDRLHRKITASGAPYQANRAAALLSKMFSLAIHWKLRSDNPAKGVERNVEEPRQRYLSGEELARLMAALAARAGQPSADAIRLLLLTGARRSEVLGATWDQFDLGEGVWTKPSSHTKQKRMHRVPLSAPARQLLAEMWAREQALAKQEDRDPSTHLFPARGRKDAAQGDLKKFWQTVCGEADLAERVPQKRRDGTVMKTKRGKVVMMWHPTVRVHDLRHSYASSLAGAGLSLPVIGQLLGHTQAQTTQRYAHLQDAALRAATERVGAVISAAEKGGKGGAEVHDLPSRVRP